MALSFFPILILIIVILLILLALAFVFLLVCLIVGYILISKRKGKTVAETMKETKPVEAMTAAFQIRNGGLVAMDDEDDADAIQEAKNDRTEQNEG